MMGRRIFTFLSGFDSRTISRSAPRCAGEAGVFEIVPASDGTAYQEYVLTNKGEGLFPVIVMLRQWGKAHLFARGEKHSVLIDRQTGRPVRRLTLTDDRGKPLVPADTAVRKVAVHDGATR